MICSQHVPRTCKNWENLRDCEDNWDYKEYKACALNIAHCTLNVEVIRSQPLAKDNCAETITGRMMGGEARGILELVQVVHNSLV